MKEMTKEQVQSVLTDIQNAKYHILFSSFIFGAGRMEDEYGFRLTDQNENRIGNIIISLDQDSLHIELNEDYYNLENTYNERLSELDMAFISEVDELITKALMRDDKEYMDIAGIVDGQVRMPGDYGDIDREDILTGRWKFCEGFA